ncbi:MAG: SAM-dependent methyltransferase [Beijerinckiaceae bacterium]
MTRDPFDEALSNWIVVALGLTDSQSRPNLHELNLKLRDFANLALNVKSLGYELSRQLAAALPRRTDLVPYHVGLHCKASTQADIESEWVAYWCSQLKTPVLYHRKLWEFAYLLQALWENGLLSPGMRGLGFGCGEEPIPSYLAAQGVSVAVTDLAADDDRAKAWINTAQHTRGIEKTFQPHLVDRVSFDQRVTFRNVDMTDIPDDLRDYDFCWSLCSLEHLGSIAKGLDFVEKSLATVKPGGLSVHTTEFNYLNDKETIDNWATVLFQRAHFQQLAQRLRAGGHSVAELDFDVGDKPLDNFIDVPPFPQDWNETMRHQWGSSASHLKLSIDGFASTCFGLLIRRAS